MLRRLEKQTPYAEIASRARHLLEQGEALFALDAALDRRYFAGLANAARLDRQRPPTPPARHGWLHGRPCELGVRLLRYRFAYNLSPAQAYYLLIPASHRLLPQQMQQLAQCASFEDAMSSLSNPFDKILEGARNTTEVTLKMEKENWRIADNILRHSNFNVDARSRLHEAA